MYQNMFGTCIIKIFMNDSIKFVKKKAPDLNFLSETDTESGISTQTQAYISADSSDSEDSLEFLSESEPFEIGSEVEIVPYESSDDHANEFTISSSYSSSEDEKIQRQNQIPKQTINQKQQIERKKTIQENTIDLPLKIITDNFNFIPREKPQFSNKFSNFNSTNENNELNLEENRNISKINDNNHHKDEINVSNQIKDSNNNENFNHNKQKEKQSKNQQITQITNYNSIKSNQYTKYNSPDIIEISDSNQNSPFPSPQRIEKRNYQNTKPSKLNTDFIDLTKDDSPNSPTATTNSNQNVFTLSSSSQTQTQNSIQSPTISNSHENKTCNRLVQNSHKIYHSPRHSQSQRRKHRLHSSQRKKAPKIRQFVLTQAQGTQNDNYEDEEDVMDSSDRRFIVDESDYFSQLSKGTSQLSESSYQSSQINDDNAPNDGITLYRLYNIERDQRAPEKLKQYASAALTKHNAENNSDEDDDSNQYEDYYYSSDYYTEETLSSESL